MKLRGIDFGYVFAASGTRGFFGEGYWFHPLLWPIGLRFGGATFNSKSMTVDPHQGYLRLSKDGITLQDWFPDCILVNRHKAVVLNAVGLTNSGAEALFAAGQWQRIKKPFLLSLALISDTPQARADDLRRFKEIFKGYQPEFCAPVGLELDWSCPSIAASAPNSLEEIMQLLGIAGQFCIPTVVKINIAMPVEDAKRIAKHPACDAIAVSNAIPWGQLANWIDWQGLFGTTVSPLAKYGGGGLSGRPLLPIVLSWLYWARSAGLPKPIIAGGGVLSCRDADDLILAGASAISLGSISLLRPHRVARVIRHINRVYAYRSS